MSAFPEKIIDTPFGKLIAWATSGSHVGIRTEYEHNKQHHPEWADAVSSFPVNGVPYTLRADVNRASTYDDSRQNYQLEKLFPLSDDEDPWVYVRWNWLDIKRADVFGEGATDSARRKITDQVIAFLTEWLTSDEAVEIIEAARLQRARENLASARQRLEDANAQVESAEAAYLLAERLYDSITLKHKEVPA